MHRLTWLSPAPPFRTATIAVALALAAAGLLTAAGPVRAGPVVQLDAAARSELPHDEMVVELAADRAGASAEKLNDEVLAALNLALAKAKTASGVRARLGSITTQPDWGPQGKRTGWRVRGVLVLEGDDLKATASLAGELATDLQIAGVSFRLTDAARTREESRLLKSAAAAFAERARETAVAFGFTDYTLKTLSVNHAAAPQPPRPMAMEMRASAAGAPALPTDGGNATVTMTINGSVELK